jgi:hypothetical protein
MEFEYAIRSGRFRQKATQSVVIIGAFLTTAPQLDFSI